MNTTKIILTILALTAIILPASAFMTPEMQGIDAWNPFEYELKDSLEMFLASDNVSEHEYIWSGKDCYICTHFATDLAKNLDAAGYDAGVLVQSAKYQGDRGHLITWVTINNEIIIIEAGNDYIHGTLDEFKATVDMDRYVVRCESIESGERKSNEMYKRLA